MGEQNIYPSISWLPRQNLGVYSGDTTFRDFDKIGVIRLYEI